MANKGKFYWEKRQELTYLAGEKKVSDYYRGLQKAFEQAKKEIQSVINEFFMRYAKENKVSFAEAQKQLSRMELGELQEFIDLVNESIGKYNLKLTNMSIKARITRYQALEKQIDVILQRLYALEYEYKGKELLKEVYTDAYYRTWYNIDQYYGFHQEFARVNPRTIDELIRYPFNGADFSSRIWKQKDHMLQVLTEDITTMLVQGKNPQTLAEDFARRFNTKEYEAYRLLHTESSFIIEQGSLAAYKEDEVEKYQILATLDHKTSEICREQDGEIYDVDKATVGVNYPPFHPFCRTTTVPYYEDVEKEGTRVARDPKSGKSYEVPANMTYKDWKKAFVDGGSKAGLKEILPVDTISKNVFVAAKDNKIIKSVSEMTKEELIDFMHSIDAKLDKYDLLPQTWNGKLKIDPNMYSRGEGYGQREWDKSITVAGDALQEKTFVHELLHGRSNGISNVDVNEAQSAYCNHAALEEGVVESLTKALCEKEGWKYETTSYENYVNGLREAKNIFAKDVDDIEFFSNLLKIPLRKRGSYLKNEIEKVFFPPGTPKTEREIIKAHPEIWKGDEKAMKIYEEFLEKERKFKSIFMDQLGGVVFE